MRACESFATPWITSIKSNTARRSAPFVLTGVRWKPDKPRLVRTHPKPLLKYSESTSISWVGAPKRHVCNWQRVAERNFRCWRASYWSLLQDRSAVPADWYDPRHAPLSGNTAGAYALGFLLLADSVAKLLAALRKNNYRIRLKAVLNRCCASVLILESILLNFIVKIVLQQNRHRASLVSRRLSASCGCGKHPLA